jgi:hypothetical protein
VVTRREWEAEFPGARATFYRLADGEFGGGGVFVLDSGALRRIEPMLQRAFAGRKSLLGMAAVLGSPLTVRCVLGHVIHSRFGPSTDQIRGRVEMLSGCRCAVVRGCSPRVKADVDDQEDWLYTLQAMAFEPAGAC